MPPPPPAVSKKKNINLSDRTGRVSVDQRREERLAAAEKRRAKTKLGPTGSGFQRKDKEEAE